MPDGKQPYCKRCAAIVDSEYRRSLRAKVLNAKRQRRWKRKNKEKVSELNRIYYQKNKEKIMCRRNTECLMVREKINRNRPSNVPKYKYDIVIDPKPKEKANV
jgi:hypothetical protein